MKFVDLFAGLGGFHLALTRLGHECVFASELDPNLADVYSRNFQITPVGDIRSVDIAEIPSHDVLCAGFPCQPFSKAGGQKGLKCPQWGDLIDYVVAILRAHKPEFFIIENVPNLVRHNHGRTWHDIQTRLEGAGYSVKDKLLSPHMFGIPQIRERAFIVGRRGSLTNFKWPEPLCSLEPTIRAVLDKEPEGARKLPSHFINYLDTWQSFLNLFPQHEKLPSFPIWAMEFGATYPYAKRAPHAHKFKGLGAYRGAFGIKLSGRSPAEVREALPPYAQYAEESFPAWKVDFIMKNRVFYRRHKRIIDSWLPAIKSFAPSFQKFEWNVKGGKRNIWDYIIQFRASGIRVKRPTTTPSLVAMTTSQVPVIGWERRYMTPRECSRVQSMGELQFLPASQRQAYRALGNAVNVTVVEAIASQLLPLKRQSAKRAKP